MVVAVLMTSCQVSLKWNRGPSKAQIAITAMAVPNATGRPGGVGGQDLWVATRATTADPWSTPVNLGPTVNSTAFDGAPALSFDGTTLYFFSARPGGFGANDLYVTTRTRLGGPDVAEAAAVESHEKAKARGRKETDKKEE